MQIAPPTELRLPNLTSIFADFRKRRFFIDNASSTENEREGWKGC